MAQGLIAFHTMKLRDWKHAHLQSTKLIFNSGVNLRLNLILSESSHGSFLCEQSRSIFCMKRPGGIVPGKNCFCTKCPVTVSTLFCGSGIGRVMELV